MLQGVIYLICTSSSLLYIKGKVGYYRVAHYL